MSTNEIPIIAENERHLPPRLLFDRLNARARELVLLAALLAVYFLTRLPRLDIWPLNFDEATHLGWALLIFHHPDTWLQYLFFDFHGPLFLWLAALLMPLGLPPLITGRLISVIAGAVAISLLYLLAQRLWGRRVALIAAMLYLCSPFLFWHDRLALLEALGVVGAVLVLFGSHKLAEEPNRRSMLLLTLGLSVSILLKISALFLFAWPLVWVLVARSPLLTPQRRPSRTIMSILIAWMISLEVWVATFAGQLLGVTLSTQIQPTVTASGGSSPIVDHPSNNLSLAELLRFPVHDWVTNFSLGFSWLFNYATAPVMLLAILALILAIRQRERTVLALLICGFGYWFCIMLLARSDFWFARYLLPGLLPVLLAVAWAFQHLLSYIRLPLLRLAVLAIPAVVGGIFILQLLINPALANLDPRDRDLSWSSDVATTEQVAARVLADAEDHRPAVLLGVQARGIGYQGPQVLLTGQPNITVRDMPVWIWESTPPLTTYLHPGETGYIVIMDESVVPALLQRNPGLQAVATYPGWPPNNWRIYRLTR